VASCVRDGQLCFVGWPRGWDGFAARDRYGVANVYWVSPGPGVVLPRAEGTATRVAQQAQVTEHFEEDVECGKFLFAPDSEPFEHWMWANASVGRPAALTLKLKRAPLADTPIRISLACRGRTATDAEPDHHTVVQVAGLTLEDAQWDGQTAHVAQGVLPAGQRPSSELAVEVACPGDTPAGDVDSVAVDYARVEYTIRAEAPQAQEIISVEAGEEGLGVALAGPAEALDTALDVTDAAAPVQLPVVRTGDGSVTLHLPPGAPGLRRVLLVARGRAHTPVMEPTRDQPDLHAMSPADYLIVTDSSLQTALQPLIEHREREGLVVGTGLAPDIYDQYSHGLPTPEAIRAFVAEQYARAPEDRKPRFLLLAGDANYDYRDALKTRVRNLVPAMLLRTDGALETAVDAYFVNLETETTTEALAVGRIPARTPEEVARYVAKVIEYEQELATAPGEWRSRLVVAADHDLTALDLGRYEDGAATFGRAMATNRDFAVTELFVRSFLTPEAVTAEQRQAALRARMTPALLDAFRAGALFVSYRGHGGEWGWSRDRVLETSDVLKTAGKPCAIVLDTSCFTGWFDNPLTDPPWSVAEAMLFSDFPVVACVAPSRLGGDLVDEGIVGALGQQESLRLGEALRVGRQSVLFGQDRRWSIAHSYCLLGDPALKVATKLPTTARP